MGIRNWIKEKLGINALVTELNTLREKQHQLDKESYSARVDIDELQRNQHIVLNEQHVLMGILNTGFDVVPPDRTHRYGHGWAVINIAGKPEYTQFYDLNPSNASELVSILRKFKKTNRVIDTPPMLRPMMMDQDW